ncbi:MAG: hypothetical protein GYB65_14070 [Chloroflexi bacterium]|nr:hypothetical protein [Chloroflexota bacterium]
MHQKLLPILAIILIVTLLAVSHAIPAAADYPSTATESALRLQGARIYFSESSGESSRFDRSEEGLSRFAGLLQRQGAELFTLEWRNGIPANADLVIIAGPADALNAEQTARLWVYLVSNGGRVMILTDPPIDRNRAFRENEGLFELTWPDMGVRGVDDVVVTEGELRTITPEPEEPEEGEEVVQPEPFEAPILITDFVTPVSNPNHGITQGIEGEFAFFTARPLQVDASIQLFEVVPLIFTEEIFYGEGDYRRYQESGEVEYLEDEDTARGSLPLAAIATHPTGARLVLIGDREFATNAGGFQTSPPNSPSFMYTGNVEFMVNAVSWLLDSESPDLTFPTPAPTSTPLATPEGEPAVDDAAADS